MRLIKCVSRGSDSFELISFDETNAIPPYAILSHTWLEDEEISYQELLAGTGKHKAGYDKLRFCNTQATVDGLEYFWVDTCCINKSDMQELQTAINSMFRWYQCSRVCYVYLPDVRISDYSDNNDWEHAFRNSRWFTRGWTLQELLAPKIVQFFSNEQKKLGDRQCLLRVIHDITKIPIRALEGFNSSDFTVRERMSWAVQRSTAFIEDKVYCLLGLFGVFLPLIYGEGEEHAELRLMEEIQRRRTGQGTKSLHDLTMSVPLPFPRNESFVARAGVLDSLQRFLQQDVHRSISICGLGGCGKSAVALELAYRTIARYPGYPVFWVPAINQDSFDIAYREIANHLHIASHDDDIVKVRQWVKHKLSSKAIGRWLMIVDNADDADILEAHSSTVMGSSGIQDYLPNSSAGKIIFTTRSAKIAENLTPSSVLQVPEMSEAEARQLLHRRLTNEAWAKEGVAVDELLDLLTFLPLAIVQAAAFINRNGTTVADYVSLFRQVGVATELLSEQFDDSSRYQQIDSAVLRTWHLSFDQIHKQDRLAAEYLSFMACINRANIPLSLLPPGASAVQREKAIGTLKGYAFINEGQQIDSSDRLFNMHRLVHMVSEQWLHKQDEKLAWTRKAAARLTELIPIGWDENKQRLLHYFPHAIHITESDSTLDPMASISLLDRVSGWHAILGQYTTAERMVRRAMRLRSDARVSDHEDTFNLERHLIEALNGQGRFEEAESMTEDMLARSVEVFGIDHQQTVVWTGLLACSAHVLGRHADAEEMHTKMLKKHVETFGTDNYTAMAIMSHVASALASQGRYTDAEPLSRQSLAQCEKMFGIESPLTLLGVNLLASVLGGQGRYEEALELSKQTVLRAKKIHGVEHPDTLHFMSVLAELYAAQSRYEEAATTYRRILASSEVRGLNHPRTLAFTGSYARVLIKQGKYAEAESILAELLDRTIILEPDNMFMLWIRVDLSFALFKQGRHEKALSILTPVMMEQEECLGQTHRDALESVYSMAHFLMHQERYREADAPFKRAHAGFATILGTNNPATLSRLEHLLTNCGPNLKLWTSKLHDGASKAAKSWPRSRRMAFALRNTITFRKASETATGSV